MDVGHMCMPNLQGSERKEASVIFSLHRGGRPCLVNKENFTNGSEGGSKIEWQIQGSPCFTSTSLSVHSSALEFALETWYMLWSPHLLLCLLWYSLCRKPNCSAYSVLPHFYLVAFLFSFSFCTMIFFPNSTGISKAECFHFLTLPWHFINLQSFSTPFTLLFLC